MNRIDLLWLIEDDPIATIVAKRFIIKSNRVSNIVTFENGKKAFDGLVKMLGENKLMPQVIIVDINMPVWNGWEFLEEFHKIDFPHKIEFFILTSSLSPIDIEKAKKYGLENRYLEKPLDLERLDMLFDTLDNQ